MVIVWICISLKNTDTEIFDNNGFEDLFVKYH